MLCSMCDGKLKITVTGGEFFVAEDCDISNVQLEPMTNLEGEAEGLEEMLSIKVECVRDPSHFVFGSATAAVKADVFMRIAMIAREKAANYRQPS